jgi:hypothetical protein
VATRNRVSFSDCQARIKSRVSEILPQIEHLVQPAAKLDLFDRNAQYKASPKLKIGAQLRLGF